MLVNMLLTYNMVKNRHALSYVGLYDPSVNV